MCRRVRYTTPEIIWFEEGTVDGIEGKSFLGRLPFATNNKIGILINKLSVNTTDGELSFNVKMIFGRQHIHIENKVVNFFITKEYFGARFREGEERIETPLAKALSAKWGIEEHEERNAPPLVNVKQLNLMTCVSLII